MAKLQLKKLRWIIIAWLMLSTILNYMDRQTLSVLAPFLRGNLKLTTEEYSNIVAVFMLAYTVMYTVGGRFVDWVGERVGMAACIIWWSIATMLQGLAGGAFSLGVYRFLMAIGEPGNYAAALRATTSWFAKEERGLPIAIYSSGSAVGAVLAPPFIAWMTLHLGWRYALVLPGLGGLIWVAVWIWLYKRPPQYKDGGAKDNSPLRISSEKSDDARRSAVPIRWVDLLKDRNVLALFFARLLADPVWYFYLFWIPEYLSKARHFSLAEIGVYGWIPYLTADVGGIFGGVGSDWLTRAGLSAPSARRRMLYASACVAPIGVLAGWARSPLIALTFISVVTFICFIWFINTTALVSDLLPEQWVGSVQGLIGTAGSGGSVLFTVFVGFLLSHFSYAAVFLVAGSMHLLAALVLWSVMRDRRSTIARVGKSVVV